MPPLGLPCGQSGGNGHPASRALIPGVGPVAWAGRRVFPATTFPLSQISSSFIVCAKLAKMSQARVNAVYYPSWRVYKGKPPSCLDLSVTTHVFYAFVR